MSRSRPHRGNRRRGRSGGPRGRARTLTGTLVISRPGAGYVETSEGSFDLARHGQREAMNGDEVEVALVEQRGMRPRAVVRSVTSRAVETFLRPFCAGGAARCGHKPLDARIGHDFFVVPEDPSPERLGVSEGDVVIARITEYPTRKSARRGDAGAARGICRRARPQRRGRHRLLRSARGFFRHRCWPRRSRSGRTWRTSWRQAPLVSTCATRSA